MVGSMFDVDILEIEQAEKVIENLHANGVILVNIGVASDEDGVGWVVIN